MSEELLDARNLLCPLPVIKVQNQVRKMQANDLLTVLCTDPGTLQDIPSWCRIYKHKILSLQQEANEIIITIKVGAETE